MRDHERHPRPGKQRRARRPQVVKTDLAHDRPRPQPHATDRAGPRGRVRVLFDVGRPPGLAAPANMLPALDKPSAPHGPPEDLFERRPHGAHVAVRPGKHVGAPRSEHGFAQERPERIGDRQHVRAPALRRRGVVGAAHRDRARVEVHVGLLEPQQLALAQPRPDRARNQRAPAGGERVEQRPHLLGPEHLADPLRNLAPGDGSGRVHANPEPAADGQREHPVNESPQVIERLRAERAVFRHEEPFEPSARHLAERERPESVS